MHCSCVRQTELPGTSSLFKDVLYHPDRTSAFYRHPIRDLEGYRAAAHRATLPPERRALLVEALRVQNPQSESLTRLAQDGTVAVVTGQQVGLFSGPAYTVYKILHAIRLAEWLSSNDIPAVPIFWLATEDHDFAEVNHAWVFNGNHHPTKVEMRRTASSQPVGGVTLATPPVRELREALHGLPYGEEVADLVEETYRAGSTMGRAFSELLRRLLGRFDVLQVDPMLPQFRELAAPAMRAAVESAPDLTTAVLERNAALKAAGYHAQVHIEPHTSFVFLLENGKRQTLRRNGSEYTLNGVRFTAGELMDRATSLSPNAVLRPVIQDSMLPTAAYIGGPAETAYLAQSAVIYDALLDRMPVAVPRTGFTIFDEPSYRSLERYGLTLQDFFQGEDALRERMAAHLVPPALHETIRATIGDVDSAVTRLERQMLAFDPTLAKSLARSARKVRYQFDKVQAKAGREAMRRSERATADASALYNLIYPERHLQERLYSFLPFLARHGWDLIGHLYDNVQLDCPDHRLMVV